MAVAPPSRVPIAPSRFLARTRLLDRAARVAAPAAFSLVLAACCPPGEEIDAIYLLRDPDTNTQSLIDACRDAAPPDCTALCRAMLGRSDVHLDNCEMHADRDGYLEVHVGYWAEAPPCE